MCGISNALYSMILMLCGRICLSLFRIPIICEHLLVILSECFFQFKFESSVNPRNLMILFCCASELGPPEDLSAIEVILYYYYYYYSCIIYFRYRCFNSSMFLLSVKDHKLGFCYIK